LGLLEGRGFQGSRRDPLGSGRGHLFHFVHIDVQARPLLAKIEPDHDFSQLSGGLSNLGKVGGSRLSYTHDLSILGVMTISAGEFSPQQSNQLHLPRKVLPALTRNDDRSDCSEEFAFSAE
jgi:hypothetical protein